MNKSIDKSTELQASLTLINDRLHFNGIVDNNQPVSIDYTPPAGDNLGYTSLELFLLSLGSCLGSSVLTMLRRMKKEISGFSMNMKGIRKTEHPTGFKTISIEMNITTSNASEADVAQALKLSEDTYCPVWAMIKGNVDVTVTSVVKSR